MSSDLSFLIQNENEVQVDQSFLEKYQKQPTTLQKINPKSNTDHQTPKKEIKLKKKMTQIQTSKKKKLNIKSYTSQHFPQFQDKNKKPVLPEQRKSQNSLVTSQQNSKYFQTIEAKIQQMNNSQKVIQDHISLGLFELKHVIQANQTMDKNLMGMLERTRLQVKKTQKGIGQILNLIEKHSELTKGNEQIVN